MDKAHTEDLTFFSQHSDYDGFELCILRWCLHHFGLLTRQAKICLGFLGFFVWSLLGLYNWALI
ncbi:unnamed protein product [Malus baccata var. baccata]